MGHQPLPPGRIEIALSTDAHPDSSVLPDFAGDAPMVAVMRGHYVGSLHRGTAAVVGLDGVVRWSLGNIEQPVFLRSAAKPFQVMPALLSGAIDRFGIEPRELAVLCASHSGEPRHQEAVRSVLAKIGLGESALHCGTHSPLHEPTAADMVCRGVEPSPVWNNCSGAHAGMLAACRASNWPTSSYGRPDHPLQQQIREILASFAELPAEAIARAGDNCHIPTFRLPIRNAALAFARLASGTGVNSDLADAAALVVAAMTAFPEMVGGEGRFDTDLMAAAGGALVAKGGAEGFQGIGTCSGAGLAIKITDGNARAIPPAALAILSCLHLGNALDSLDSYRRPELRDRAGEVVGSAVPVFATPPD